MRLDEPRRREGPVDVNNYADHRNSPYIMRDFADVPRRKGYLNKALAGGLLAAIGLVTIGVAKSNFPERAVMIYRQKIAEPAYAGRWGPAHRAEGKYLWNEVQHHDLPGDPRYWIDIIEQNPENKKSLEDGYQKGDTLRIPEPDRFGR